MTTRNRGISGFLLAVLILCVTYNAQAATGDLQWAHILGSTQYDTGRALAIDTSNNVYIVGRFLDTIDIDPGVNESNLVATGADAFIGKFDRLGNLLWAGSFGGPRISHGLAIAVDTSRNVYMAGSYCDTLPCVSDFDPGDGMYSIAPPNRDEIFVCKLDSDGNFEWARSLGGPGTDFVRSIKADAWGDIYVSGYVYGVVDLDPGPGIENWGRYNKYYSFILKLNSSGEFVWARASAALGEAMALNSDGNIYTVGSFASTVDFDPGPGVSEITSFGFSDIYLSKFDAEGMLLWVKRFGGADIELGKRIHIDKNDFVYISGSHGGGVDFDPGPAMATLPDSEGADVFLAKVDVEGSLEHFNFAYIRTSAENSFCILES